MLSGTGNISNTVLPGTPVTNLAAGINTFEWKVINGVCKSIDTVSVHVDELIVADAGLDSVMLQHILIIRGKCNIGW